MSKFNFKEYLSWRNVLMRFAIVIGTVAVIVWAMPHDSHGNFSVEEGKPWKYGDFRAPFDFPVYKSDTDVKHERDSLLRLYEPYYNYDVTTANRMVNKFLKDYEKGIDGLPPEYIGVIVKQLRSIYNVGVIGSTEYNDMLTDTARTIRIVNGKNAVSVRLTTLYSAKTAYEQLFTDELTEQHRQELQRCDLNAYITPNLTYDKERSEASRNDLLNSIPLASGVMQKGQKIIGRGEIVDGTTHRILESYKRENDRRNLNSTQTRTTIIGQTLYIAILILSFTIYLSLFRKDYFEKPRSTAMLYALIIIFAMLTSLLVRNTIGHVYIIPYAMLPIFIRVFMDSRTAFTTHVVMVLVCASILQHPFDFVVIELVAGLTAIFSLRELQYRSQLFRTAIVVALASAATNLAYDMMNNTAVTQLDWGVYNYFVANGMLLLFAYPLLYLMEKVFGFISDITLIELSNTNNPLLRRMSEVAPGTFQHSIQVGNLAAEIANKIGAKSQLVRTGALYHDIGKMQNPIYFTENQSGVNPHENLSYIESAQIIISHVTEGLKLADKNNLPTVIKDFISTHHGQGKTKFFYVKYKNEHEDEDIDDLLFTYPGPNPFTKEQAILMMADSVEAASRSLPDYTEQSIRDLVNKMVDGMLADGYFRECPITFRDVAYAKTVMIEKLKTIYHTRVSYPTLKKE